MTEERIPFSNMNPSRVDPPPVCNPSPDIDNTSRNGPDNINSTGNPVDILTAYLNHNDQLSFAGCIEVIGGVVTVTKRGSLSTLMSGNLN